MKIFLVAFGTGGSEVLNEVYQDMKGYGGHEGSMFSVTEWSASRLKECHRVSEGHFFNLLKTEKPDIVISETSNGRHFHLAVTKECKRLGIFNISILDVGGAFSERFKEIPDVVLTPCEEMALELKGMGIRAYVTGNPAYDLLERCNNPINRDKPKILFISQGLTTRFTFMGILKNIVEVFGWDVLITIRPHPQEDKGYFFKTERRFYENITVETIPQDPMKHVEKFDLIIGTSSTVLHKSSVRGLYTIASRGLDITEILHKFKKGECIEYYNNHPKFMTNATRNCRRLIK